MATPNLKRFALLTLVALSGCTVFPVYKPSPAEATAPLKVSGWGIITFRYCDQADKDRKQLDVDAKTLTTLIPAGKRVVVNAYRSDSGYQVVHYCNVRLNFEPEAKSTYVLNSGMVDAGKCFIELVKEDLSTDTGLVLEPSARGGSC